MGGRENGNVTQLSLYLSCNRINLHDPVHLIPEKFDAKSLGVRICGINIQHISFYPETAAFKVHVVAVILDLNQFPNHVIPVFLHPRTQRNNHVLIIDGTSQTVNTGNRCHNDHITPLRQGRRGRMTQLINLVVNGGVFFNIGICRRDIGFGLVVVVVGNKIFHRILREELLKLAVKLGGQCLIVRYYQSGLVQPFDYIGHGEGLSRTRNA